MAWRFWPDRRQWCGVTAFIDKAGEGHNLVARDAQVESQAAALEEIVLGQREHRWGRGHDVLPAQGKATAASRFRSTLA
jgi:hypothetical protein